MQAGSIYCLFYFSYLPWWFSFLIKISLFMTHTLLAVLHSVFCTRSFSLFWLDPFNLFLCNFSRFVFISLTRVFQLAPLYIYNLLFRGARCPVDKARKISRFSPVYTLRPLLSRSRTIPVAKTRVPETIPSRMNRTRRFSFGVKNASEILNAFEDAVHPEFSHNTTG